MAYDLPHSVSETGGRSQLHLCMRTNAFRTFFGCRQWQMIIVGIDIGLVNLGICKIKVHKLGKYECLMADLVDTTHFKCDRQTCQLRHEACHVDWVSHLLQSYKEDFDKAEIVCIERQPPGGHAASEQLLFAALREKAVLIHPRSFIAWMCIGSLDYEFRKVAVVNHARRVFAADPIAQVALGKGRAHDIADALLQSVFHVETRLKTRFPKPVPRIQAAAFEHMESFRNVGKRKRRE